MIKNLDKLKELGIDIDVLIEAHNSEEEKEITLPEGKFYRDVDIEARDNNMKSEGKKLGVQEGKEAMKEIANKTIFDKFGIRDIDKKEELTKVLDIAFSNASKGDEALKKQVQELIQDKQSLEKQIEDREKEKDSIKFDTQLLTHLPKNRSDILNDNEYINIIKGNIDEVDGIKGLKINGEIAKDPTTKAILPIDKAILKFFETRDGWVKKDDGGRGGNDDGGKSTGGIKTYSQAEAKFREQNPDLSETSPQFVSFLQKCVKEEPAFDMDK